MGSVLSALDLLVQSGKIPPYPLIIVFGEDAFLSTESVSILRTQFLQGDDAEFSFTSFEEDVDFKTVISELATRPMFGEGLRVVRIPDADSFVSQNSPKIIEYLNSPSPDSVLILQIKSCPSNSPLYTTTAKKGLLINAKSVGTKKSDQRGFESWIVKRAKQKHQITLSSTAAGVLRDQVGNEPGMIDNELARIALLLPHNITINDQMILKVGGSWRTNTAWEMLDAFIDGHITEGLEKLDRLINSGVDPIAILAQITSSCRKYTKATRIFLAKERIRRNGRNHLDKAIQEAGFPSFTLGKVHSQMVQLGRLRGETLLDRLIATELALKGKSYADKRTILEQFLIELGHHQLKGKKL